MIVLTLIGLSSLCQAQALANSAGTIQALARKLPDGSYEVVLSNGQRLKGVTNSQLNEQAQSFDKLAARVQGLTDQLQVADKQIEDKEAANKTLAEKVGVKEQERDSARRDLQDARVLINQQSQTIEQEVSFRKESVQMIPEGELGGFWGKIVRALNHPASQAAFKIGAPIYQMIRCQ